MRPMKRGVLAAALVLCAAAAGFAQGGNLGSAGGAPVNAQGKPLAGISVAVCQPMATTAASLTANLAVLTMASNPITAGFAPGMTIMVSGFSGGDTYFNGGSFSGGQISNGYTILSVTPTTIVYALNHANANATSNGTVLQEGNSSTPCAGLSSVYSDSLLTQAVAQPGITTDGNANWSVFAAPGVYYEQFYGAGVSTYLVQAAIACVPNAGGTPGCTVVTNQPNSWTALQTFLSGMLSATAPSLTSPVVNGTPTGTGIPTTCMVKGSGAGNYTSAQTSWSASGAELDSTNLVCPLTVPVGWKVTLTASASGSGSTTFQFMAMGIADGTTVLCAAYAPGSVNDAVWSTSCGMVGDGASHTFNLRVITSNAADTATIFNTNTTDLCPHLTVKMEPSN